MTSTVTWIETAKQKPLTDQDDNSPDVLLFNAAWQEKVCLGTYDPQTEPNWTDSHGYQFWDDQPTHWAHLPEGPA